MGHKSSRERSQESESSGEESQLPERQTQSSAEAGHDTASSDDGRVVQRSAHDTATEDANSRFRTYADGPDSGSLSDRYGIDVSRREAGKLQRLEREFGDAQVRRWADEGMPVETMGKPRDMKAFRAGENEIPGDTERQNRDLIKQNTETDGDTRAAGPSDKIERVISSTGASLDETVQREMESKIGGDFSDVQLHTGNDAAAAADSIRARAFTVGNHIAFNKGEYNPKSNEGKKVLAHELTHVQQQTAGRIRLLSKSNLTHPGATYFGNQATKLQPQLEISSPDDPEEREAERVAKAVVGSNDLSDHQPNTQSNRIDTYRRSVHRTIYRQEDEKQEKTSQENDEPDKAFYRFRKQEFEQPHDGVPDYVNHPKWNNQKSLSGFLSEVIRTNRDDLADAMESAAQSYDNWYQKQAVSVPNPDKKVVNAIVSKIISKGYSKLKSAIPVGGNVIEAAEAAYDIFKVEQDALADMKDAYKDLEQIKIEQSMANKADQFRDKWDSLISNPKNNMPQDAWDKLVRIYYPMKNPASDSPVPEGGPGVEGTKMLIESELGIPTDVSVTEVVTEMLEEMIYTWLEFERKLKRDTSFPQGGRMSFLSIAPTDTEAIVSDPQEANREKAREAALEIANM